jgi:hypothetical protein
MPAGLVSVSPPPPPAFGTLPHFPRTPVENGGGLGRGPFYVFTSAFSMPTPTEDYVCTTCGYFESYIADQGKLNEVAQKWEKVQ